jgi:hypothetical protein
MAPKTFEQLQASRGTDRSLRSILAELLQLRRSDEITASDAEVSVALLLDLSDATADVLRRLTQSGDPDVRRAGVGAMVAMHEWLNASEGIMRQLGSIPDPRSDCS